MATNGTRISAIITAMDNLPNLRESVAVLRDDPLISQIVAVNQGSRDGTREWLDEQDGLVVVHPPSGAAGVAAGTSSTTTGSAAIGEPSSAERMASSLSAPNGVWLDIDSLRVVDHVYQTSDLTGLGRSQTNSDADSGVNVEQSDDPLANDVALVHITG